MKALEWAILFATIGGASFWAYKKFVWTKSRALKYIKNERPDVAISQVENWDEYFIIAWAKALYSKTEVFQYQSKIYNTKTARAI